MTNHERLLVGALVLAVVLFALVSIQHDVNKRRRLHDARRAGRREARLWAAWAKLNLRS